MSSHQHLLEPKWGVHIVGSECIKSWSPSFEAPGRFQVTQLIFISKATCLDRFELFVGGKLARAKMNLRSLLKLNLLS